ncbi:unnamed protein product [Ascophyllum nodosum]
MANASIEILSASGSASSAGEVTETVQLLVCVECGRPVPRLFREYNKGSIRLGRCDFCRSVADKYIECEFVLVAIDLVLHRVQAYRHLLFNRRPFSIHSFHGRLWQLGMAMSALDAHLRHTALSSEAAEPSWNVPQPEEKDIEPLWEAGGILLASMIEHAFFCGGAVLCGRIATEAFRRQRNRDLSQRSDDYSPVPGEFGASPAASKMYMALVYPMFFRLLAAFVMIWDRQVTILNTTEIFVATMQFVALSAVLGGSAAVGGMGENRVAAAAVVAGLASKMVVRGILCLYFGTEARTLRML